MSVCFECCVFLTDTCFRSDKSTYVASTQIWRRQSKRNTRICVLLPRHHFCGYFSGKNHAVSRAS